MIRRGFWLTAGVVTGIYGYRRVSALGRRVSGRLTRQGTAGLVPVTREALRFTRDVREGMELYMARHCAPAGSTLSTDHDHDEQPEDGR